MKLLIKLLSLVAGAALLLAIAHVTITYMGGYQDTYAVLVLAVAAGVGIGAVGLGSAWSEGRRFLCFCTLTAMVAGELFGLIQTSDRIIGAREAKQAPARAAAEARRRALARLDAAQKAFDGLPITSPQLENALAAKATVDQSVMEKSATKACAANCRALLDEQLSFAEAEVAGARAQLQSFRDRAESELAAAGNAVVSLPPPASGTALADRLGVEPWVVDLIAAVLGSIGANGLAACLLAFGSHSPSMRPAKKPVEVLPALARVKRMTSKDQRGKGASVADVLAPARDARGHAAKFGVDCLRPDPHAELPITRLHDRYRRWCDENRYRRLPPAKIASELKDLFNEVGLKIEERGKNLVICGLALAD